VLSGAQLAFLEDLALLRRERSFRWEGGLTAETLELAPEAGSVYVRRLLRARASHGPARAVVSIAHGDDVSRQRATSALDSVRAAWRAFAEHCSGWLMVVVRARGAIRARSAGP
jgi:hypothetical protein